MRTLSKLTLTAIAAGFAFSTAFAGTFSKSCIEEVMNLSEEDGFDMQDFIKELLPAAIKVKAQAKAPLQFLLGPGPDNKVTNIGLTVGCLKALPESPGEIKSLFMNAGLEVGKSVATGKLRNAGLEVDKSTAAGKLRNDINTVTLSEASSKCDIKDYKTVKIGTQTWMAENLNCGVSGSKCYNNDTINCTKYGRLYDWSMAMALSNNCNSNTCSNQVQAKHRGICPEGWHIPSNVDWDKLYRYVDGINGTSSPYDGPTAGISLKAKESWSNCGPSGSGKNYLCEDAHGFSALPGGFGYSSGNFFDASGRGYWWSTNENNSYGAYNRYMSYCFKFAGWLNRDKRYLLSVRCVKDE